MHIFYADKAEWFDVQDDAPKYAQRPDVELPCLATATMVTQGREPPDA
jgi:hypothetical protein